MVCFNCKSKSTMTYFSEIIPCSHCGGQIIIMYNSCVDCGAVWKSIDDEFFESMLIPDPSIIPMIEEGFQVHLDDSLKAPLKDNSTMSEIVHRCIKCESIAYEVNPEVYHCSKCGFEWEVL